MRFLYLFCNPLIYFEDNSTRIDDLGNNAFNLQEKNYIYKDSVYFVLS